MTEDETRKAQAQAREFPETMEIMGRIRNALAETLFQTGVLDSATREQIYIRVQALDTMTNEMAQLLVANAGEREIREYVERLNAPKE